MRASSWKKRRMRLFLCVRCIFLSSAGALFKGRLGGRVFLRMARARLLSREPETLQKPSERPGMHPLAEALLADIGQVLERVGRTTAGLWIGPIQHGAHQLGLLLRVERGRATIAPAVGEAVDPMLVVAQHPVAQRLPVHACRPGCLLPAHAVESAGDRQDAARHTRVGLGLGQLAKNCRRAVLANLQRSHDALPRIIEVRESRTAGPRNRSGATRVDPSVGRYNSPRSAIRVAIDRAPCTADYLQLSMCGLLAAASWRECSTRGH